VGRREEALSGAASIRAAAANAAFRYPFTSAHAGELLQCETLGR
jgi:hypothetical protein